MIEKKITRLLLVGIIAWGIMLPLLLGNYFLWGRIDWITSLTWDEIIFFGVLTLICLFVTNIFSKITKTTVILAGFLRWIFIIFQEVIYGNIANIVSLLFLFELPIMIFSYYVSFKIIKTDKKWSYNLEEI